MKQFQGTSHVELYMTEFVELKAAMKMNVELFQVNNNAVLLSATDRSARLQVEDASVAQFLEMFSVV